MKKRIFLAAAILAVLPVVASAAAMNPLVGRWNCWHDSIPLSEAQVIEANRFTADASRMTDERYLFRAIEFNDDTVSDEDREQYGAQAYVTFDGSDITIDIPNQSRADTARATLEVSQIPGGTKYKVSGAMNVESRRMVGVEIPVSGGGTMTIPGMSMEEVPVRFFCEKTVRNKRNYED